MTKTIIIGEKDQKNQKTKFIEVICYFNPANCSLKYEDIIDIGEWKFVELICRGYSKDGYDLMFAYDNPSERELGLLYLGKWNNGVVE